MTARQQTDQLTVAVGVGFRHRPGAVVDRPHGLGTYLFVSYRSPMLVRMPGGMAPAEPGDCILFDPAYPQFYQGRGPGFPGFVDDWLHVDGPFMPGLVRRFGIPLNSIMRPRENDFIAPLLEEISREMLRREPMWADAVRLLVESLFLQLGRQVPPETTEGFTPREEARPEVFRNLRMEVHERLHEPWTVARMAERIHMSPSRFALLYTKFVGTSPMEDLIRARLQRACILIAHGAASVKEVAHQTGFRSTCHFSRLFRKRVGCAPRDYHPRFHLMTQPLSEPPDSMA